MENEVELIEQLNKSILENKDKPLITPSTNSLIISVYERLKEMSEYVAKVTTLVLEGSNELPEPIDFDGVESSLEQLKDLSPQDQFIAESYFQFKFRQDELFEQAIRIVESRLPDDEDHDEDDYWQPVYEANGQLSAQMMINFLQAQGIEAFADQESAGIVYGLTVGPMGVARIYVRTEQFSLAKQVIDQMERGEFEDSAYIQGLEDTGDTENIDHPDD